jgi:hypothetical protein
VHSDLIVHGLLTLFPEADQSCKNAGRFFFGSKQSTILNQHPIPTQKLLDILCIELITGDKGIPRRIPSTLLYPSEESAQTGSFYIIIIEDTRFQQKIITQLHP